MSKRKQASNSKPLASDADEPDTKAQADQANHPNHIQDQAANGDKSFVGHDLDASSGRTAAQVPDRAMPTMADLKARRQLERSAQARLAMLPPVWVRYLASIAIGVHVLALIAMSLAPESGPWPSGQGGDLAHSPVFAARLNSLFAPNYLVPTKFSFNHHFPENKVRPTVSVQAKLLDAKGQVLQTIAYPSAVWPTTRSFEQFLARSLAEDEPVVPPEGTWIAPKDGSDQRTFYWDRKGDKAVLASMELHKIPRDQQLFRPKRLALLSAQSLARHLGQRFSCDQVELTVFVSPPIPVAVLESERVDQSAFAPITYELGKFSATP